VSANTRLADITGAAGDPVRPSHKRAALEAEVMNYIAAATVAGRPVQCGELAEMLGCHEDQPSP
jgi:hypothetical protein